MSETATAVAATPRFTFTDRAHPWRVGTLACGYAWRAERPTASLVLIHGLQSHSQWSCDAAECLAGAGVSVYALDRRGSGSSTAPRGDIDDYHRWLDEVRVTVALARREQPDVPVHLLGHCFGANLALGHCLTGTVRVDSLIMATPGLFIKPRYHLAVKMAILASGAVGGSRRFPVPQRDEMFSRDPEVVAWIRADDLGARTVTARCLLQAGRLAAWVRRDLSTLNVPMLVLAASRDRISDNRRTRDLLEGPSGRDCTWLTFDAEHFLFAEPCSDQVLATLVDWIEKEAA